MRDVLLVLNAGSSSLKFQIFARDTLDVLLAGKVTGIGTSAELASKVGDVASKAPLSANDHDAALETVLGLIDRHDDDWKIVAVVHRVVHGGERFAHHTRTIDYMGAELAGVVDKLPGDGIGIQRFGPV